MKLFKKVQKIIFFSQKYFSSKVLKGFCINRFCTLTSYNAVRQTCGMCQTLRKYELVKTVLCCCGFGQH